MLEDGFIKNVQKDGFIKNVQKCLLMWKHLDVWNALKRKINSGYSYERIPSYFGLKVPLGSLHMKVI